MHRHENKIKLYLKFGEDLYHNTLFLGEAKISAG